MSIAEYVYQSAKYATIDVSPFEAIYSYNPEISMRLEDESRPEEVPAVKECIADIHKLREELKERWRKASDTQAKAYNKKQKPMSFNIGDLIILSTKNLK